MEPTHVVVIYDGDDGPEVVMWWPLPQFGGEESFEDEEAWSLASKMAHAGGNRVGYARYEDGKFRV